MTADRSGAAEAAMRVAAVAEARRWLGTPYVHQASCLGAGADCLGLVRGIWRAVLGREPEAPGPYSADWAEAGGGERLAAAADRLLVRHECADAAKPGDVLLFRMRRDGPAKHLAVLSGGRVGAGRMIHAYSGHAVCETSLGPAWARRLVEAYGFPLPKGS